MIKLITNRFFTYTAFVLLGATCGFVYYQYLGCDGSCAITSSPVNSSVYGAVMGFLLSQVFEKDKTKEKIKGN
ncbi:MAG: hypothetical protein O9302_01990 [Cyclobacteriaceae bacterium]|jgi:uncharacterized membrane protein YdjX (TVP38/TMEM64 family)|nr:hypothetical protein [Cytophagales bacterium]MCZ8326803.1 hypothetical protein [Cyclobacteriaceae bacterium]